MDTVKRAAALLDRARPGWENEIDTETLDLIGMKTCVLGQVFGGYVVGLLQLARLDLTAYRAAIDGYPFAEAPRDDNPKLTAWLTEIHERRSAKNTTVKYTQEGLFA